MAAVSELAERLGYRGDERLLIITCDDLGLSHASNAGVYQALRDGVATSASLMVPCPWARDAAQQYRGEDVGVHLTITSEFDRYRWGPITHAPSLLDGDGGFPRTVDDTWEHADPDEVRRECRAQIERAVLWGFDVSHLDSHRRVMPRRPELFDIYLEMAYVYRLPIQLPDEHTQRSIGFPFRRLAREEGILFPDRLVHVTGARQLTEAVHALEPGVTEIHLQPAIDTGEARAISTEAGAWADDLATLVDPATATTIAEAGVTRIGYRALRDAQRA